MTKPDDLVNSVYRGESDGIYPGLTKREYFATMAMQGIMTKSRENLHDREIALEAVNVADALIYILNIDN